MSIGNTLKEARTKKTLTLEEVHAKIKIHPHVLQLLEEEKFEKLPSPLFAKSFLKSYADFLEVNAEEAIKAYEKSGAREPQQSIYIGPAETKSETVDIQKILTVTPFLILAVILVVGALYYAPKAMKLIAPKDKAPLADAPKPIKSAKKLTEIKKEIKKTNTVKTEPVSKRTEDWLRSPEAGNFPKVGKNDALNFELKAVDAVWVEVTVDGKILFQGILKKGSAENWIARNTIEIWTGNAANMLLSINKTSIGSPGKGRIRRMQISREGVRVLTKEAR